MYYVHRMLPFFLVCIPFSQMTLSVARNGNSHVHWKAPSASIYLNETPHAALSDCPGIPPCRQARSQANRPALPLSQPFSH